MPERIQQRRAGGWRKPENTVSVARPSRFGNPFRVKGGTVYGYGWFDLREHPIGARLPALEEWTVYSSHAPASGAVEHAVDLFRTYTQVVSRDEPDAFERWIAPLRGKSLMCFCPLEQPCHADVLLELANRPTIHTDGAL